MVADSSLDNLSFQLTDPVRKNVYRFRAPSPELAKAWVQCLHHGVRGKNVDVLPTNLISFEWKVNPFGSKELAPNPFES